MPGTTEAADALADTQIPQTTAVKRDQTLEVTYDGEPKFKAIEGTGMAYATNTSFSVCRTPAGTGAATRRSGTWRRDRRGRGR